MRYAKEAVSTMPVRPEEMARLFHAKTPVKSQAPETGVEILSAGAPEFAGLWGQQGTGTYEFFTANADPATMAFTAKKSLWASAPGVLHVLDDRANVRVFHLENAGFPGTLLGAPIGAQVVNVSVFVAYGQIPDPTMSVISTERIQNLIDRSQAVDRPEEDQEGGFGWSERRAWIRRAVRKFSRLDDANH